MELQFQVLEKYIGGIIINMKNNTFCKYYEARKIIRDFVIKDFIGPVKDDEIISEPPIKYYSSGILYAQGFRKDKEEIIKDNDMDNNSDEEVSDEPINLTDSFNPSAMAISTTIKKNVYKLKVNLKYAKYKSEKKVKELKSEDNKNSKSELLWKRYFFKNEKIIDFDKNKKRYFVKIEDGLELQIYMSRAFSDGSTTITVVLLNKNKSSGRYVDDNENSYFQVGMSLSDVQGKPIFIEKKPEVELNQDEEIKNLNMLYSHIKNFAVGHGCSVEFEYKGNEASKIKSTFLPCYELKQMKPSIRVNEEILNMNFLATGDKDKVCEQLKKIVASYDSWINEQKKGIKILDKVYRNRATKNLELCEESKGRINNGIYMIENDNIAFKAFQLANKAMLIQRIQFFKKNKLSLDLNKINWYPFQLAFILQEITSIINNNNEYRNIVDLLWFPTGGGKTEAYLGLAAFVIFLRNLRKPRDGDGTTVIMRYTLRMLTMDQFERAHALICACEKIRRQEKIFNNKVNIGLYVGSGITPNKIGIAKENLNKIIEGGIKTVKEGNPYQISRCPWCGAKIQPQDYVIENDVLKINCPDENCDFSRSNGGLPVYIIDDNIYDFRPTLIVSTVDKFARMTWEPKVGNLFGVDGKCDPPELIIQDELHLISGPLGTITGLYEVAFRKLCEKDNIGAKIIASTATIRNARSQIKALYGKDFRQFPASGINIRDSYFAQEADKNEKPTRLYNGILAPGKSVVTTQVRLYAILLFASRYLKDMNFPDEVVDTYWTLVGYFNSLRELGGTVTQVYDDIQARYEFLYTSKFNYVNFTFKKKQNEVIELTSGKSSSEISETLQRLKESYKSSESCDIVLATNMISVGIDISRLGIMIITGQPKTNAEYIQASSRVGRKNPGILFTLYNPSRSRDISHYEQFTNYHSTLYKYVEATSLTPFSPRARDKALHAVFISLCRHLIRELKENDDAGNLKNIEKYRVDNIKNYILGELKKLIESGIGLESDYAKTACEIENIYQRWLYLCENKLIYDKYGKGKGINLISSDLNDDYGIYTLNSMRNVDAQSNIYVEED